MGDFVVRRVDGIAAYQVACSIDDAEMNCTQILRGADLLASTARQILILNLNHLLPAYAHVGLVVDANGERPQTKLWPGLEVCERKGSSRVLLYVSTGFRDSNTSDLEILTEAFELSNSERGQFDDVVLIEESHRNSGLWWKPPGRSSRSESPYTLSALWHWQAF